MPRCPNCNQKVNTDTCTCCGFPILEGWEARHRKANKKAKKLIGEAEKKARKKAVLAARDAAKREAEAAKQAREAEKKARKKAVLAAEEEAEKKTEVVKQDREIEESAQNEATTVVHQGDLRLVFQNLLSLGQLKLFVKSLQQVEDLEVSSVGGSEKEGVLIGVSVLKPMPLSYVFDRIHMVDKFEQNQDDVRVVLKKVYD
jgi:vacuolar-type H+-ATPase subunit I/STV1